MSLNIGRERWWVMLIMSELMVLFRLVEAAVRSLGLCRQFKGLRCGVSFWFCSFVMLCIWGLTGCGSSCCAFAERSSWFCSS